MVHTVAKGSGQGTQYMVQIQIVPGGSQQTHGMHGICTNLRVFVYVPCIGGLLLSTEVQAGSHKLNVLVPSALIDDLSSAGEIDSMPAQVLVSNATLCELYSRTGPIPDSLISFQVLDSSSNLVSMPFFSQLDSAFSCKSRSARRCHLSTQARTQLPG